MQFKCYLGFNYYSVIKICIKKIESNINNRVKFYVYFIIYIYI